MHFVRNDCTPIQNLCPKPCTDTKNDSGLLQVSIDRANEKYIEGLYQGVLTLKARVGAPGKAGPPGAPTVGPEGAQGKQGERGDQGEQGPAGEDNDVQGPPGPEGAAGAPGEKGADAPKPECAIKKCKHGGKLIEGPPCSCDCTDAKGFSGEICNDCVFDGEEGRVVVGVCKRKVHAEGVAGDGSGESGHDRYVHEHEAQEEASQEEPPKKKRGKKGKRGKRKDVSARSVLRPSTSSRMGAGSARETSVLRRLTRMKRDRQRAGEDAGLVLARRSEAGMNSVQRAGKIAHHLKTLITTLKPKVKQHSLERATAQEHARPRGQSSTQ